MKTIPQKALFLDRDGIINIDHGYVSKIENFEFIDGIFDLLHLFLKHHYTLFIVTNQSGIGRDYYSQQDFDTLTAWMMKRFKEEHISIEQIYHCPHAPEAFCGCRKPQTGMIEQCLKTYTIDLKHSWMIGDKQSDIDLAYHADIGSTIAIGNTDIKNSSLSFGSILACKEYLEENQGKILQ
jgi:D-glycero-D-manno-heptose 1,7-bisphosphate phosphatase